MKVLLVHASLGSGHRRAAHALLEVFEKRLISATVIDLLEEIPSAASRFYSGTYQYMITRNRTLWKFVYDTMNKPAHPYRPGQSIWQRWQFTGWKKRVQAEEYSHIVATHFTPAAILADWRRTHTISARVFTVVTDHVAHRCWKRPELDHYFVPSQKVSLEFQEAGIEAERITISGIPVSQSFGEPPGKKESREKWKCEPGVTVFLLLCSGFDLSYTLQLCRDVASWKECRCLVSTGTDPAKEERVRQEFARDARFTVFGFSPLIAEMMSAADLIITKPGGLVVSEALAMGLPQILLAPIPGQEEANAEYSAQKGAAICLKDPAGLKDALRLILDDSGRLQRMAQAARAAGKPDAAKTIVDRILTYS